MKKIAIAISVMLGFGILSSPALAHVDMSPGEVPAGKPVKFALEVGHGCGEAPTTSLLIQIPGGAEDVKALKLKGWKGSVEGNSIRWQGGPLPSDQLLQFPVRATLYGKKGQTLSFKTIQRCRGGEETAWIQEPVNGEEPANPTPSVTLTSTAKAPAAPDPAAQQEADDQVSEEDAAATGEPTATDADADDSSDDGGGSGLPLTVIIVIGLAIGTVAGIVLRARRSQK